MKPAALLSFFGILGATLYLYGYWSRFGIDPFPYVEVGELLLYALKSAISVSFFAVLGVLAGFLSKSTDATPPVHAFSWRRETPLILGVFVFLAFAFAYRDRELLVATIVFASSIPASFKAAKLPILSGLSESEASRQQFVVGFFLLPVFCLNASYASALLVRSGPDHVSYVSSDDLSYLLGATPIGKLGDYDFFFLKESKETIIVRSEALSAFAVSRSPITNEPIEKK